LFYLNIRAYDIKCTMHMGGMSVHWAYAFLTNI